MFDAPVLVFAADTGLRTALKFSLELQGFRIEDGRAGADVNGAGCLIVDQDGRGEGGLPFLVRLREEGCRVPAILLATNPTRYMREKAASLGVRLVEKPLLCDTLTSVLHFFMYNGKAA